MSWEGISDFPCLVASASLRAYQQLPKKGKPQRETEWTPLAAILKHDSGSTAKPEVVSLGTGSKCIGQSKMNKEGWVVNDSHAEVVARRAFLRYLLKQLSLAVEGNSSIFLPYVGPRQRGAEPRPDHRGVEPRRDERRVEPGLDQRGAEPGTDQPGGSENDSYRNMYVLRPGVTFHFFSTQIPCGDAAIFPQPPPQKRKVSGAASEGLQEAADHLSNLKEKCNNPDEAESFDLTTDVGKAKKLKLESRVNVLDASKTCDVCEQMLKPSSQCPHNYSGTTTLPSSLLMAYPGSSKGCEKSPTSLLSLETEVNCCRVVPSKGGESTMATSVGCEIAASEYTPSTEPPIIGASCLQFVTTSRDYPLGVDTHRTGAKCVGGGPQDRRDPGQGYHVTGALRTKPGRGDATLSMSCSDKILRWNILGCQGALLSHFIAHPIFFETLTISSDVFNREALTRAVCKRPSELFVQGSQERIKIHHPTIFQCECFQAMFEEAGLVHASDKKLAPGAVCYCAEPRSHEVLVQGLLQGVNLKVRPARKASSLICKRKLLEEFLKLLLSVPADGLPVSLRDWNEAPQTYRSFKVTSFRYNTTKCRFLSAFPMWLTCDEDMESFSC